jgi:hypothetical protein
VKQQFFWMQGAKSVEAENLGCTSNKELMFVLGSKYQLRLTAHVFASSNFIQPVSFLIHSTSMLGKLMNTNTRAQTHTHTTHITQSKKEIKLGLSNF